MPSAKGKKVVSAEIAEAEIEALDVRAKLENRSRAEIVIRACRFYLRHAPVEQPDAVPDPIGLEKKPRGRPRK